VLAGDQVLSYALLSSRTTKYNTEVEFQLRQVLVAMTTHDSVTFYSTPIEARTFIPRQEKYPL